MKRLTSVLALIFSSILLMGLTGCGEDGRDGNSFLAIDWVYTPQSYWDDNPGIPSTFYGGQYYESSAGTYDFQYTAWEGSSYIGWYQIIVEEGKDASLFTDGEDGADRYFELWLYSWGPSFYQTRSILEEEASKGLNEGFNESDNADTLDKLEMPDESIISLLDADINVIEKQQGRYKMRVEYQKISH